MAVLDDTLSDKENQKLALLLLRRVGSAVDDPEILITAVHYVMKLDIDISKDFELLCDREEVFDNEIDQDYSDFKFKKATDTVLNKNVDFGDSTMS